MLWFERWLGDEKVWPMKGIGGFRGTLHGGRDERRGAAAPGGRTGGEVVRRARWARATLAAVTGVALCCLGTTGEASASVSPSVSASASGTTQASVRAVSASAGVSSTQLWQPRGLTAGTHASATSGTGVVPAAPAIPAAPAAGGAWRFEQPADATTVNGVLLADSCTASAACEAVGEYENSIGTTVTLAEARASADAPWRAEPTPNPDGAVASELTGVACISADSCLAAGYEVAGSGDVFPLAERWNGISWREQSVPTEAGSSAAGFFGVSCSPGGECTAVGEYDTSSGAYVPLVENWTRAAGWSIGTAADPAGAADAGLFGVSCPAAGVCMAVGSSENAAGTELPLAESDNGRGRWRVTSVPAASGAETNDLPSVSCARRTSCVAVGYSVSAEGTNAPLADSWNGSSWTALAPAEPAGTENAQLLSVSCASAEACRAAGDYAGASGSGEPLAESWNAKAWTVQVTSTPTQRSATNSGPGSATSSSSSGPASGSSSGSSSATSSGFAAVSCGSASSCSAVGSEVTALPSVLALAETSSGTRWRIEPTPDLPGAIGTNTSGVSCTARNFCTAVGYSEHGGGPSVPFIETWNGSRWSLRPAPDPQGAAYGELHAVSCASPYACLAVGGYGNGSGTSLPISEYWNGATWRLLPTPAPQGATDSELLGVSCASARDCEAVGSATDSAGDQDALAEHWNGSSWQPAAVPVAAGGFAAELDGVSCAAAHACIAVGSYVTSAQTRSVLAETWNGTHWRAQTAPDPASSQGPALASVSCVAPTLCTAVGTYYAEGGGETLVEAWNGKAWHIQSSANPAGVAELALNGVSCTSPDACTAVGYYETNDFVPTTAFAEAWNGRAWALQNTPVPAGGNSSLLNGVSCVPSSCTAVGYYFGYSGTQLALVEARG
jgi:hypothetical protein